MPRSPTITAVNNPVSKRSLKYWVVMILTTLSGFGVSFVSFVLWGYVRMSGKDFQGQLIAGDPSVNNQFPTTYNTMGDIVGGTNAIANGMFGYAWWIAVIVGGLLATWLLLKFTRRYIG